MKEEKTSPATARNQKENFAAKTRRCKGVEKVTDC